jgi:hypothetical protein
MAKGLSFADAATLLGGTRNRIVMTLDRLLGGVLLTASAAGSAFAVSLFDPAAQVARLTGDLVATVGDRLTGISRFDRTERLTAAHSVVVIAAYFESLAESALPFTPDDLKLTELDQVHLVTGSSPDGDRLSDLSRALLRQEIPCPAAQRPYEVTLADLDGFYRDLSDALLRFLQGLATWDELSDSERQRARLVMAGHPERAVHRYEQMYRDLAAQFPEMAFWASITDHQATRNRIGELSEGLAGLGRMLEELSCGRQPDERRHTLARANRAVLNRPILASEDRPDGVVIPSLAELYINPNFRLSDSISPEELSAEDAWRHEPERADLQGFLTGFLTGVRAVEAPLLVLGQPGSGKSALSRVLAARLPPSDFLSVLVVLRDVPADADIQTQVEISLRNATGETMTWPDVARSAGDALPVIIFDGFDELVLATGTTQSDYLERVADFQRREHELGRPAAIVVTSRTAVADRARSVSGMPVLRLEPFTEDQIHRWLTIWNAANRDALAERGLRPLEPAAAVRHHTLAAQPLLLMMLALHDSADNALQRSAQVLGEGDLYESLLTGFAEREVRKHGAALSANEFTAAVEQELTRLSVVAFALLNRDRQWATQTELDRDLAALLGEAEVMTRGLRAPLTAGQVAIGHFYFVHRSQATRDGAAMGTYEFLHATFGEYLIARLVVRELGSLARAARMDTGRGRLTPVDDDFLYALLSFSALTSRGTVVTFLRDALARLAPDDSRVLADSLLLMFHQSLFGRRSHRYADYQPQARTITGRHAAWSANVTLLLLAVAGPVSGQQLFPEAQDGVNWWRQTALLWRGQLSGEGWNGLVHTLEVCREWDGTRRVLRIRLSDTDLPLPDLDLRWTYAGARGTAAKGGEVARWRHYNFEDLRRHSHILCDRTEDTVYSILEPFGGPLDATIGTVQGLAEGGTTTPARALLDVLFAGEQALVAAYERCITIAVHGFLDPANADLPAREHFAAAVDRLLRGDRHRVPPDWYGTASQRLAPLLPPP